MVLESKDTSIAQIDGNNVVGVAPGQTAISVYTDNKAEYLGQSSVKVEPKSSEIPVTKVQIDRKGKKYYTLEMAGQCGVGFKPVITPSNATNKTLKWTSSDPTVVRVNQKGLAEMPNNYYKVGTAVITATAHNGVSDSVTITVKDGGLYIDNVTPTVVNAPAEGGTYHIKMSTRVVDGRNSGCTWVTDNHDSGAYLRVENMVTAGEDAGFDLIVPEGTTQARTIKFYIHGNFNADTQKVITVNQPYSRKVLRFRYGSEGGVTYLKRDGSYYYRYDENGRFLGGTNAVYVVCASEIIQEIFQNTVTDSNWIRPTRYQYGSSFGSLIYFEADANTTGAERTATATFPGGLTYSFIQDA